MRTVLLSLGLGLSLLAFGCTDDGGGGVDETGETSSTGDGDGDPSTGDGDGDPATGDGDGDGDATCEDSDVVRISTTMGDMVVTLDPAEAPTTVANFKAYVDASFYNGLIFHRVWDTFMIQGGGFLPGLTPAPGLMPPIPLEISNLIHVDGTISMARTSDPNSATSQFFICDGAQDSLDGDYAAFGLLTEGFDVLAAISAVQTTTVPPYELVPVEDVVINSVTYECD